MMFAIDGNTSEEERPYHSQEENEQTPFSELFEGHLILPLSGRVPIDKND
jgi:hypothetical protein